MRRLWRDLLCAGILLGLPLLFFAPVVFGPRTLVPADVLYQFQPYEQVASDLGVGAPQNALLADLVLENYAWKDFLVDAVRSRRLPLWDPYLFGGHPFLANGQHSALYPLSGIFFVLPLHRAFGVFVAIQLGMAGVSMYLLGRTLGAGPWSSLLAGVTFQFSGFMVASVVHPMIVAAASWLPLLLALVDLTVRRAPFWGQSRAILPWSALGAIVLGVQVLAGHAEATYFSLLVAGAFAAWRLAYVAATQPRDRWRADILRPALGLALTFSLGLALGAIQLLPLYEVVRSSFRAGAVTLAQVREWAYPPRRIVTFLVPNFFGNPAHHTFLNPLTDEVVTATLNAHGQPIASFDWGIKNYVEGAAYLGILPLLLTAVAVLRLPAGKRHPLLRWLRRPYVPFFTGLALFSLACVFGTPLYALVYALPFFNQSHSPFRWVFPLTVAVAALTALGAAALAEYRQTHGPDFAPGEEVCGIVRGVRPRSIFRILMFDTTPNVVGVTAIWAGGILLAGLWLSRIFFPLVEPLVERAFWSLALAPEAFPHHRAFYGYLYPWIQAAGGFLLASGVVLRVSRCPIYLPARLGRRPVWELLAIVVLLLDLLAFGTGFNPAVDPELLAYTPPVVEFLKQEPGPWRFSTFDPHGDRTFTANAGMFYGFEDVRGYDSLFPAQYARYMGWIEPQGELPFNRIAPFKELSSLDSPLVDLLNVKYLVTEVEIPLPKYELVYADDAVMVYENLGVAPRAFTLPASSATLLPGVDAVGEALMSYDPRSYVLLEESPDAWIGPARQLPEFPAAAAAGELRAQPFAAYTPNEVTVEATVKQPAWLVFGDTFFPGWKAFVRPPGADAEVEVPIARVAGNFRGVYLEESALVRFKYSPNSVKVGAFVSFLAGMTLIFFAGLWIWRRAYRETGDESTVQRVAKNSIAPIILEGFNKAVELAFAALMMRILDPAGAGKYYYAVTLFIWFDILSNFGLDAYLIREVSRRRDRANRYLCNTIIMRVILTLVGIPLLAGFLAFRQALPIESLEFETLAAIGLLYLGLLPSTINKGITGIFYVYEKAEYPAAIASLSTLLKVTLGTVALLAGWGIVGLAGMSVVISSITLVVLATLTTRLFFRPRWQPDTGLQREMLRESWPLMLNHLMATLFFRVDVVMLEGFWGAQVVGWYSVGYKFLDMLNIIPSRFTFAVFPVVSRQAHEDRVAFLRFYRLGIKLLVGLAFPIAIGTTLVARELVLVLGDVAYLPHSMIALQILVWSIPVGWMNSLTNYILVALDQQRYLTRALFLGVLFNVVANLIFMPRYGYASAAIITILSEVVLLTVSSWGMRRKVGPLGLWDAIRVPLLASLAAGAFALVLLPIGRPAALVATLAVYPLVVWRMGLLNAEEQTLLAPLSRRFRLWVFRNLPDERASAIRPK